MLFQIIILFGQQIRKVYYFNNKLTYFELKMIMLMAKGQTPATNSSPGRTLSIPKDACQKAGSLQRNALVIKANAVVINATKQPQKRNMSADDLLFSLLIVCLVV